MTKTQQVEQLLKQLTTINYLGYGKSEVVRHENAMNMERDILTLVSNLEAERDTLQMALEKTNRNMNGIYDRWSENALEIHMDAERAQIMLKADNARLRKALEWISESDNSQMSKSIAKSALAGGSE